MEGFFLAGSATLNINVKHFPVACCYNCLLDSTVKLQFNLQNTKENKPTASLHSCDSVVIQK